MTAATIDSYNSQSVRTDFVHEFRASHLSAGIPPVSYKRFSPTAATDEPDFEISFDEIGITLGFTVNDIEWDIKSNQVVLPLSLDGRVNVKSIMEGRWNSGDEPHFIMESFNLHLEEKPDTPIATFLSTSLWALLGCFGKCKVRIPPLGYDFSAEFSLPLSEISKLLQERQIAYRLMVIESATRIALPFPRTPVIDASDVESIAFCFYAITKREFDWPSGVSSIPMKAEPEILEWFPNSNKPFDTNFRPEPIEREIFGVRVSLGLMTAKIEEAVIDNYEEASTGLRKVDGEIVWVKLRSLKGISRMILLQGPSLPDQPFSVALQRLIDIEPMLTARMTSQYLSIADHVTENVSEEELSRLDDRPELDEDAFAF